MESRPARPRARRTIAFTILGSVAFFLAVTALVRVERRVAGHCTVYPSVHWSLREVRPGSLESLASDMISGQTLQYRVYQFDRNSLLDFHFPALDRHASRFPWRRGQVVASVTSSALDLELAERSTRLEEATARLASLRSGEKPQALSQANLVLARAQADLESYRAEYQRQRELNARGIVPASEWELAARRYRLRELDVQLARSELDVLSSGAKPEDVRGAEALVAKLEAELETLRRTQSAQRIASPVDGWLSMGGVPGTLVTVAAIESLVAEIFLPQHEAGYPAAGQGVEIAFAGVRSRPARGRLCRLDLRALPTEAGPFVRAYAIVDNSAGLLSEGMQGYARISCGRERLLSLIFEGLRSVVRRELWLI